MCWLTVVGIAEHQRLAMESDVYLPCLSSRRSIGVLGILLLALLPLLLTLSPVSVAALGHTARADPRTHVRLDSPASPVPPGDDAHRNGAVFAPPPGASGVVTEPTRPSEARPSASSGSAFGAHSGSGSDAGSEDGTGPEEGSGSDNGTGSRSLPDTGPPSETLAAGIVAALLIIGGGLAARALRRHRG